MTQLSAALRRILGLLPMVPAVAIAAGTSGHVAFDISSSSADATYLRAAPLSAGQKPAAGHSYQLAGTFQQQFGPLRYEHGMGAGPQVGKTLASQAPLSGAAASSTPLATWQWNTTGFVAPLTIVGGEPQAYTGGTTNSTTTVQVVLIPVNFSSVYTDAYGVIQGTLEFNGSDDVASLQASPLFVPTSGWATTTNVGTVQYNDAMQRLELWKLFRPEKLEYHLDLRTVVRPALNLGLQLDFIGLQAPDGVWFASPASGVTDFLDGIFATYLQQNPVGANEIALFVTHNTIVCGFTGCVLGYHNAQYTGGFSGGLPVQQAYAWASWLQQDTSAWGTPNLADVHTFSHELAELVNDPYINNTVPSFAYGYGGCSTLLEVGDQLVGQSVPIMLNGKTYHPQTVDLVQYFFPAGMGVPAADHSYIFPEDPNVPNVPASTTGC